MDQELILLDNGCICCTVRGDLIQSLRRIGIRHAIGQVHLDTWICLFGDFLELPPTHPHPVTVTTGIITFLIGNPYKPSFVTVTGWGVDRMIFYFLSCPSAPNTPLEGV